MNEDQKQSKQDMLSDKGEGAMPTSSWKRLMSKKWAFPALYLAVAAIILSLMWAYQSSNTEDGLPEGEMGLATEHEMEEDVTGTSDDLTTPDALPVTVNSEPMSWPVLDPLAVEVIRPYYDEDGDNETKQAAVIQLENTLIPSKGITLARGDQASFEVLAAMAGTVTRVAELPIVGHLVEITHDNGLSTVYQSLDGIVVEEGQQVEQGDFIAHAGRNELGQEDGVHLHFEIYEDNLPVNPVDRKSVV